MPMCICTYAYGYAIAVPDPGCTEKRIFRYIIYSYPPHMYHTLLLVTFEIYLLGFS